MAALVAFINRRHLFCSCFFSVILGTLDLLEIIKFKSNIRTLTKLHTLFPSVYDGVLFLNVGLPGTKRGFYSQLPCECGSVGASEQQSSRAAGWDGEVRWMLAAAAAAAGGCCALEFTSAVSGLRVRAVPPNDVLIV